MTKYDSRLVIEIKADFDVPTHSLKQIDKNGSKFDRFHSISTFWCHYVSKTWLANVSLTQAQLLQLLLEFVWRLVKFCFLGAFIKTFLPSSVLLDFRKTWNIHLLSCASYYLIQTCFCFNILVIFTLDFTRTGPPCNFA